MAELLCPQDKVLDVGCAAGAISFKCAPLVKYVHSVEKNEVLVGIAQDMVCGLKITNGHISWGEFGTDLFVVPDTYTVVLSLAVHQRSGLPLEEYAGRLFAALRAGGFLLLESHDLNTWEKDWPGVVGVFTSLRLKVEKKGDSPPEKSPEGRKIRREFVVLRKPI